MSSQIICRECNTPNAPGSKFCNNCGARLPLSTNLICPNCGTPNPRNRVFCDSCGTRLVREETPKAPSKAEEPSAGGTKAFSLPARPPGDTGELDPNTLPDWLKTGDTSTIGDAEAEDDQADELPQWLKASLKEKGADPDKLPRLEELTPEKRTTDDLPDWLVNEGDTSPIIDSPKEISTEIYLDLVSRAEDSSHEDDPFDANEASLPDWLAEAASFPDITPATSAEPDETSASDSSAESDFVSDSEPAAKSDEGSRTGLTDWLTDPDALAESTPAADAAVHSSLTDWLTDQDELVDADDNDRDSRTGPPDTPVDLESIAGESQTIPADEAAGSRGLTSWLSDSERFADLDAPAEADAGEADLTDWLADLDQLAEADEAGAAEEPVTTDTDDHVWDEAEGIEPLPSWMADITAEGDTLITSDQADEDFDESLIAGQTAAELELEWLAESGGLAPDEDSSDRPGVKPSDTDDLDEDTIQAPDQPAPPDDPDWLAELAAFERATRPEAQAAEVQEQAQEEQTEAIHSADEPSEIESEKTSEPDSPPAAAAQDDWLKADPFAEEDPLLEEELPEWLQQLGPPVSTQPPHSSAEAEHHEDDLLASEDLPDWIASLRPHSSLLGSSLPSALSPTSPLPEPLQDIPEELAGAELPEWLQDIPITSLPKRPDDAPAEEISGVPDWLVTDRAQADAAGTEYDLPVDQTSLAAATGQDWGDVLGDLPPMVPAEQALVRADLPDWVRALKPRELRMQPAVAEEEVAEEPDDSEQSIATSGPLAGMQGVVAVEPVILRPRTGATFSRFTATASPTPEQQQQVALLHQLTRSEPRLVTTVTPKPVDTTSFWLRLLLAGILIATILLGLLVPDLLAGEPASSPGSIEQVSSAIEAAAGRPVLIAFEYTPALAGELTPLANLLLAQLDANDSPVLTVSQYAAGTAVAAATVQDVFHQDLGYLPGEAVGLRQLGNCLAHGITCETIPGWIQHAELQQALPDVALIIVLTGERNSLVNWIEQVATGNDVPMVAGITQSLAPIAAPYVASGQLEGTLDGATATAAYGQAFGPDMADVDRQPLAAQQVAQLVVAAFLLIGSVLYGVTGTLSNRLVQQTKR